VVPREHAQQQPAAGFEPVTPNGRNEALLIGLLLDGLTSVEPCTSEGR